VDRADAKNMSAGADSDLGVFTLSFIRDFLDVPANNSLGPGTTGKAWDDALVGFSSGADDLYDFLKEHIGPFHWTPAEAFALGEGGSAEPGELTVISWALCQTEAAKTANRSQTFYPSEPWARTRIFGQAHNRALHMALVDALVATGHATVAPGLLAQWGEKNSVACGRASTWSERHVAYISGLGTFGLSGGLITERGQAVRFGSVIVRATIAPTPRLYDDPFAYCLFFARGICGACARRCPVGSVTKEGRDKEACARHLEPVTQDFVRREYGFDGYGCGLCQTRVPCESGIPKPLQGTSRAPGSAQTLEA
jgi:epoxyqueuosine reductase